MYYDFVINFESQKNVEFWFMISLELGKHVSWLCDELESQNKFGFGFVSDLELGQHVLWLCDQLEN
jgi:hypothetical protein